MNRTTRRKIEKVLQAEANWLKEVIEGDSPVKGEIFIEFKPENEEAIKVSTGGK